MKKLFILLAVLVVFTSCYNPVVKDGYYEECVVESIRVNPNTRSKYAYIVMAWCPERGKYIKLKTNDKLQVNQIYLNKRK